MATTPTQDPRTVVRTSERLWSEIVGAARGDDIIEPRDPAYEWSNGRRFVQPDPIYKPETP